MVARISKNRKTARKPHLAEKETTGYMHWQFLHVRTIDNFILTSIYINTYCVKSTRVKKSNKHYQ